jgi:carboxyl-terminal processing protease
MPRRNLLVLMFVTLVALFCYQRVQKNPYGRVLADAMSTIESRYLDPIPPSKLFEAAINGMIDHLDEHSEYITPGEVQEFHEILDQEFGGVGMVVALDPQNRQLMVLSPLVGSPAYKAGIHVGDKILRIGQSSTQGMSLQDALGLLRGKPGEPIQVSVLHEGAKEPTEIQIVREIIQVPTVLGDTHNPDGSWNFFIEGHDKIGYLRITSFTDKTPEEFVNALTWLSKHGMRGLVLDLRDDPGGYLDAAVKVCDMLVDSGVIVTTRRRGGHISKTYPASGKAEFTDFPIAVLINSQSASAAEIVAACLQDHHRAVIIGQRSYGKGTVQEIMPLESSCGALKLTTASYWRPSGKNINRPQVDGAKTDWGVTPDEGYKVDLTNEEQNRWRLWRSRRDTSQPPAKNGAAKESAEPFIDRPLQKAVEHLKKP